MIISGKNIQDAFNGEHGVLNIQMELFQCEEQNLILKIGGLLIHSKRVNQLPTFLANLCPDIVARLYNIDEGEFKKLIL